MVLYLPLIIIEHDDKPIMNYHWRELLIDTHYLRKIDFKIEGIGITAERVVNEDKIER